MPLPLISSKGEVTQTLLDLTLLWKSLSEYVEAGGRGDFY